MVHDLEMPDRFSCGGAQGDYRVRIDVAAAPLASVEIRARTAGRYEQEPALRIGRDHRPDIRRPCLRGAIPLPGFARRIAGIARYRVPAPAQLAGPRVESAHDAALELDAAIVAHGRSHDHEARDHGRRRSNLVVSAVNQPDVARQIDLAILSEVFAWNACGCVQSDQAGIQGPKENPLAA